MGLFWLGLSFVFIGVILNMRGNTSRFNPPSGGGSRIPPEAQIRLNESVQKIVGTKEDYDSYYHDSNTFKPNMVGIIILLVGIALIGVYLL